MKTLYVRACRGEGGREREKGGGRVRRELSPRLSVM